MNRKTILITRPLHDKPTQYLHYLSGELKRLIDVVGEYSIIDLEEAKATREKFEKALDKSNPRLVVLNSHGNANSVMGQNEVILDEENINKLKSKIIYAVVCDSSQHLGEQATNKGGADAYIGYSSQYMVVIDPARSTTPSKDKNVKPFEAVYASTVLSLISGMTVGESVEKTVVQTKRLIRDYGVLGIRDKFGDAPLIRFALYWNLYFLKIHGSSEVAI